MPLRGQGERDGELGGRCLVHRRRRSRRRARAAGGPRRRPRSRSTGSARARGAHVGEQREHHTPSTCTAAPRCRSRGRGADRLHRPHHGSRHPPGGRLPARPRAPRSERMTTRPGMVWTHPSTLPVGARPGRRASRRRPEPRRNSLGASASGSAQGGGHGSRDQLLGGAAGDRVEHGRRHDLVHAEGVRHAAGRSSRRSTWIAPVPAQTIADHRDGARQLRHRVGARRVDRVSPGTSTAADTCGGDRGRPWRCGPASRPHASSPTTRSRVDSTSLTVLNIGHELVTVADHGPDHRRLAARRHGLIELSLTAKQDRRHETEANAPQPRGALCCSSRSR